MKRITLFFTVLLGLGLTSLQAQNCAKSASACCKKSVATADKAQCTGSADAAAKLASLDETIETRTCEKSGTVSYVRRETNSETGQVLFTSIEYNGDLGKFVNVSPLEGKSCCKAGSAKNCCSAKAKSTQASASSVNETAVQAPSQKGS